jgi:rhamnose transport system permease protein
MGVYAPSFLEPQNLRDILVNSSYTAVAATGMTMVIVAGGIDISIGSILAVCSVLAANAAKAGLPNIAVLPIAVAAGCALGSLNGVLIAWARIPSIIVTLGTMSVLRGAMTWATGGYWVRDLPPSFAAMGTGDFLRVPVPVWVAAITVVAGAVFMSRTRPGRYIYAVGGSARAAELAGVKVPLVTFGVFAASGGLVGLASMIYATRFSVVQSNAGAGFELLVITAVVVGGTHILGGRGSVFGSVLGVLMLSVIGSALTYSHVSSYWEPAVQGALVLLAVVVDSYRARRKLP